MIPNRNKITLQGAVLRKYISINFSWKITSLQETNSSYLLKSHYTAASMWGTYHISNQPEAIDIMRLKLFIPEPYSLLSQLSTVAIKLIFWKASRLLTIWDQLKFIQHRKWIDGSVKFKVVTNTGGLKHDMTKAIPWHLHEDPVAEWSNARVRGRSLAGIVVSNPAGGMDVCLLWVLCVVR